MTRPVDADHQPLAVRVGADGRIDAGDGRRGRILRRDPNETYRSGGATDGVAEVEELRRAVVHDDDLVVQIIDAPLQRRQERTGWSGAPPAASCTWRR